MRCATTGDWLCYAVEVSDESCFLMVSGCKQKSKDNRQSSKGGNNGKAVRLWRSGTITSSLNLSITEDMFVGKGLP